MQPGWGCGTCGELAHTGSALPRVAPVMFVDFFLLFLQGKCAIEHVQGQTAQHLAPLSKRHSDPVRRHLISINHWFLSLFCLAGRAAPSIVAFAERHLCFERLFVPMAGVAMDSTHGKEAAIPTVARPPPHTIVGPPLGSLPMHRHYQQITYCFCQIHSPWPRQGSGPVREARLRPSTAPPPKPTSSIALPSLQTCTRHNGCPTTLAIRESFRTDRPR